MQIRDEHELKRNITLALQKAHFGDYEISIRLLIDIIEYQQKQIDKLLKIDEMKTEAAKFIKENYNIERKNQNEVTDK